MRKYYEDNSFAEAIHELVIELNIYLFKSNQLFNISFLDTFKLHSPGHGKDLDKESLQVKSFFNQSATMDNHSKKRKYIAFYNLVPNVGNCFNLQYFFA